MVISDNTDLCHCTCSLDQNSEFSDFPPAVEGKEKIVRVKENMKTVEMDCLNNYLGIKKRR